MYDCFPFSSDPYDNAHRAVRRYSEKNQITELKKFSFFGMIKREVHQYELHQCKFTKKKIAGSK